ncbi:MAG: hypothetical protein WD060_03270, partial [Pirellulales bacterium]
WARRRALLRAATAVSPPLERASDVAAAARQPIPSTKKLEQEITNEDRQLKRLTDRLAKLDDTHLDAVPALAVLKRLRLTDPDSAPVPVWDSIQASPAARPSTAAGLAEVITPLIYDRRAAARKP